MESTKKKIIGIVRNYIADNSEEYELVKKAVDMQRAIIREYPDRSSDTRGRPLYEISEKLQGKLIFELDEEETMWFKTKEGGNWFAKEFPVFALTSN